MQRKENRNKMPEIKYIILCLLHNISFTMAETVAVYSTPSHNTTLKCGRLDVDACSSVTWLYSSVSTTTVALSENLTIKYMERAGRLSVGRDCSLHIYNVSTEDGGQYTCRSELTDYTSVYVSVLTIVPQRMADGTLNLQCLLYTDGGPGQCHNTPFHKVSLKWLSDTGTEIQKDLGHQEHISSCDTTLTVKLKGTNNREWTCQLLDGSEVKTSLSYSMSESSQDPHKFVIAGTAAAVALVMIISVCLPLTVKFRRRTEDQSKVCQSKSVNNCSHSASGQRDTDGDPDNPDNQYETVKETTENTLTYSEVLYRPSRQKQEGENSEFCTEYVSIKIAQT